VTRPIRRPAIPGAAARFHPLIFLAGSVKSFPLPLTLPRARPYHAIGRRERRAEKESEGTTMEPIKIDMQLINDKVKFLGASEANPTLSVPVDYVPPIGSGEGFLGLELLVISFAGCVSTAIVGLLRRMGKAIGGYRMRASGIRQEAPLSLAGIDFVVEIESADLTEDELEGVIRRAQAISPVWIALNRDIEVTWRHEIRRAV
jgi:putative redox protein